MGSVVGTGRSMCARSLRKTAGSSRSKPPGHLAALSAFLTLVVSTPAVSDYTRAQQCTAQVIVLPNWLKTNVPPGSQKSAQELTELSIGVYYGRTGERTQPPGYAHFAVWFLDGDEIEREQISGVSAIGTTVTWSYHLQEPLGNGLHHLRLVFPSVEVITTESGRRPHFNYEKVLEYAWEFCVVPGR